MLNRLRCESESMLSEIVRLMMTATKTTDEAAKKEAVKRIVELSGTSDNKTRAGGGG